LFDRRAALWVAGIILVFAIGLIGYFVFSADYGDGLENTMEKAEVEEEEPLFSAPFDYGESYPLALSMGFLGLTVTLTGIYLVGKIMRKKDAS